jgi:transposase
MKANSDNKMPQLMDNEDLVVVTERVDDVALLIGQMIKMGLPEVIDDHLPRRGKQRNLSWGWTATVWLAYILTEGDHRKVSVAQYIAGMRETLSKLTGQEIEVLDFDDDRLSHLLAHLSDHNIWESVENELNERTIEVFELPTEVARCDPTTVSGFHEVSEDGLMQFGHSKDDPSLPQIKLSAASLDPLGMPLATEVVSGETADDGLYLGLIERVSAALNKSGLLFVGDCKMSSLGNRTRIASNGHFYLSPLAMTGGVANEMPEWINQGIVKDREEGLEAIFRENDGGKMVMAGCAYEFDRPQSAEIEGATYAWQERVIIVWSPAHSRQQRRGLEKRLASAQKKIEALTPPVGRGKRQIKEEEVLTAAVEQILKKHRVESFLTVEYEKECETQTQYVGRGRGSSNRQQRTIEKVRYKITAVKRNEEAIEQAIQRFGWKAFATNSSVAKLSLADAVLCYRNEYRVERIFNRLKSRLNIAPLFVKRDDQIEGLTYMLTLGVRVLTLIEFVVRRSLQADNAKLPGLHPENKKKETDKPTAERILKAFSGVTLTIIKDANDNLLLRWVSPLSAVQQDILNRLGLNLFYELIQNSG